MLIYTGAEPPSGNGLGWRIARQTGKPLFSVEFPSIVPPGMGCWAKVLWYNRRGQYSPASEPLRTYPQVGPLPAAA